MKYDSIIDIINNFFDYNQQHFTLINEKDIKNFL